jgi:hypothetical protein
MVTHRKRWSSNGCSIIVALSSEWDVTPVSTISFLPSPWRISLMRSPRRISSCPSTASSSSYDPTSPRFALSSAGSSTAQVGKKLGEELVEAEATLQESPSLHPRGVLVLPSRSKLGASSMAEESFERRSKWRSTSRGGSVAVRALVHEERNG